MTKVVKVDGMTCGHCSARVEKALNELEGVTAKVDLDKAEATVSGEVTDELIRETITEAGYEVVSIN